MKHILEALSELDQDILHAIQRALAQDTASLSSLGSIVTGNAYQSVRLRDIVLPGFRQLDPTVLAGISLYGRRFVDLGCNFGEHTRLAAQAGTAVAEGVDLEPFFVRIGTLINAYNGISNVVLREGDLTQPGCLRAGYDVGACFSSYVYVEQNLDEILSRIQQLFLLETHALDSSWYNRYVPGIAKSMPYWLLFGFTDQSAGASMSHRGLMAFGRDRETVGLVAINRSEALATTHRDVRMLDVANSRRAFGIWGSTPDTKRLFQNVQRTLAAMTDASYAAIADTLRVAIPPLLGMVESSDVPDQHFGSDRYCLHLFRGLVEFVDRGALLPDNPYLVFLRRQSGVRGYDAGMTYELAEEGRAVTRLTPRLAKMLEIMSTRQLDHPLVMYNPLSLGSLSGHGYAPDDQQIGEHVMLTSGIEFRTQYMDGNHRLAALWLGGGTACPVLPVWTNIFGLGRSAYKVFGNDALQDSVIHQTLTIDVLRALEARRSELA